jgi:hypothetical protein
MKRRQGTIRKRGSAWEIKFEYKPREGSKRFTRYATVRGTRQDAQKKLTELLRAADTGMLPDPSSATVAEYLRSWLDSTHTQSPKTLERYHELAEHQIIPHLGAVRLQALTPAHIGQWHSSLMQGGLSARTCGHDVDLGRGIVHVQRSVEETRKGLRTKEPKTRRGRRNVGIAPDAVTMLREHRKKQIELRLALGQGGQPVLVFPDIEGNMLSPDNLSRDWRRVCDARKLPRISFHGLRHCHASLLLAAGVPVLTVSRRLGHAKASQTLDVYAHLLPGADADATKAIEGVLK